VEVGSRIAGRFELESVAGAGAMGTVYRARDLKTGAAVAVKVLLPRADPARFDREARVLRSLDHPGIVRYVDHAASHPRWLAMEWLEGEDLARRLARQPLSVDETVRVVRNIAEALGAAHARGILHRDLKPANVFLVDCDLQRVKLVDFGLARAEDGTFVTRTGDIMGTPGYMAPEMARGDAALDARADVFSLGCVLYRCLTGRHAFDGENVIAVLAKVLLAEPVPPSELVAAVPEPLDDLVGRMLSKEPLERPADGRAVALELDSAAPPPASTRRRPTALGATEQRIVSVVLVGAARSIQRLDLDSMLDAAGSFRGEVQRLVDGSLAVLLQRGGSATDLAARAASCALRLRELSADAPIAVATGRAELGGRVPVGEAIDRAGGLVALGGRDVAVDELTAGLLDERFERERAGDHWLLTGQRETDRVRTLLGKPTRCVGRDTELAMLDTLIDQAFEQPVATAVVVSGPPGIGKSRLRIEVQRRVRRRHGGTEVWLARADPVGTGAPFALAAQLLRRTAGIKDGERLAVRREKLRARIARVVGDADLPRIGAFLAEMIGAPFAEDDVQLRLARRDPMLMGDQMRRAWEDFVAAECAAHPLLVVLEDLHWGDRPTIDLVDTALRRCAERPLLVMAVARPEIDDMFPDLWTRRDPQRVRMRGLPRRAAELLVRDALGASAASEVVERIVEQAGGNAFHLEELVRAAAEGSTRTPDTLLAVVQCRLDALDADCRRALRAASVFGDRFWEGAAVELLGAAHRADVGRWLEELTRRELLLMRDESEFDGQRELRFRHGLIREAAYATLTEADRTLGHRLAAQWLESAGETDAAIIATHFDLGGEPTRAMPAHAAAAEQALEGNDFAATLRHSERAAACGADAATLANLRRIEAEVGFWRGEYAEAARRAEEAVQLAPRGGDVWGEAASQLAASVARLGGFERLAVLGRELLEMLAEPDCPSALARPAANTARALLHGGQRELAGALLEAADRVASEEDPIGLARLAAARSVEATYGGDVASPVRHRIRSIEAYERAGDARSACDTRMGLGYLQMRLGLHAEAEATLMQALDVAERFGLATSAGVARQNLGSVLARQGRLDEALAILAETVEVFRSQRDARFTAGSSIYLASVLAQAGRLDEAEAEARQAVAFAAGSPPLVAHAHGVLASVLIRGGRCDEALRVAEAAMALSASVGGTEDDRELELVHAEALHAVGDLERARACIGRARDRLLELAVGIEDPAWRRAFLEAVPENARMLALAADWLGQ
jgi:eukaryotic-like serine/threonine-protein kinase